MERTSRLQTFGDLGPADLCNIHKAGVSSKKTELGTFLYFTGVDTSNSASIAAHLQGLATLITSRSQYWFGEKRHWRVPQLTYCTYNTFSKVDMRVTVHIPGKFESSVVNSEGKLIHDKLTEAEIEAFWLETFVCSVVRCMIDSDEDDAARIGGLVEIRKENLFNNGKASKALLENFILGFEKLFWQGPKLGCSVEIPQPTLMCNYLIDGFLKCVHLTQSYDQALEVLHRLQQVEPAVTTLIAQVLLMRDEEVKAVQVIHDGILKNNRDSELFLLQTKFLVDKKRYDLALHSAKQAVQSSPSDFKTWALLVQVYTKLNDFENALLTLNSCPMNSHKDKFFFKRVVSVRSNGEDMHLPSPVDVTLEEVSNLLSSAIIAEQKSIDPQLSGLPAANLKSTFAKAYDLLTEIVVKTGWESLLKHRAKVFVMEEEYRKEKNNDSLSIPPPNGAEATETDGNDGASTTAVKSPKREGGEVNDAKSLENEFRKKRLCERWLDNLFMLLYEDLRVYTVWQAEYVHFQAQQIEYKRTTLEWEVLGLIAFRLKHFKEGSIAFTNALRGRFSAKSQREMLKYYLMERTKILSKLTTESSSSTSVGYTKSVNQLNERILESCIKLLVWNHRWYNDFSPFLILAFNDLVAKDGLIKIQSLIQAVFSNNLTHSDGSANHGITDMMEDLYTFVKSYGISGSEN